MILCVTFSKSQLITLESHGARSMIEIVVFIGSLAVMLFLTVLYTKRMLQAQQKYAEAKTVLNDIVLSFSKQLQRQDAKLAITDDKVTDLFDREICISKALQVHSEELQTLAEREVSSVLHRTLGKVESLEKELKTLEDSILARVAKIEELGVHRKESVQRIEYAIPIKREKALAPLTSTELTVLELLASEGEKTAPEIKTQINLSREHTARLMKKLYAEGYLERSADKIPFKYRLKEEMHNILRSPEQKN